MTRNKTLMFIKCCSFIILSGINLTTGINTYAKERYDNQVSEERLYESDRAENELEQLNLDRVDEDIKGLLPKQQDNISVLVKKIRNGEIKLNPKLIREILHNGILGNLKQIRKMGVTLVTLGVISALFSTFSSLFKNHQIADISFYFLYMLFVLILMTCFREAVETADTALENTIVFMRLLVPTFFFAVGMTTATSTAVVFYQLMLVIITIVEKILASILLPGTSIYVFLSIMNGIGEEDRFSAFIDLMKKGIEGSIKVLVAGVTGFGFLQSMITPVIDSVRTTTIQKTLSVIPGIGGIADSTAEIVLGSTVLIKNSVGIAFVILLLSVCAVPLLHILLLGVVVKISAAFIGMVCDKRLTKCADEVGDGTLLVLKILFTALALFVITIAIVISATNHQL